MTLRVFEKVSQWLDKPGHTRAEICERLGISNQTLASKLSGESEFKLSEAAKLAQLIGCKVSDFVE